MSRARTGRQVVLGFDPGLADFGFAAIEQVGDRRTVIECGTWVTTKRDRSASDLARRARFLTIDIAAFVHRRMPDLSAIGSEQLTQVRSSQAAQKTGVAWGALNAVHVLLVGTVPFRSVTATEVKFHLTSDTKAKKVEVESFVRQKFPELEQLLPKNRELLEHACDAVAVADLTFDLALSHRLVG